MRIIKWNVQIWERVIKQKVNANVEQTLKVRKPNSHTGHYTQTENSKRSTRNTSLTPLFLFFDPRATNMFSFTTGAACERMSCPGGEPPCSGHGTCLSQAQLAENSLIHSNGEF